MTCVGLCERLDALQGYWKRSTDGHEHKGVPGIRRSVHFLEDYCSPAFDKALSVKLSLNAGLCERWDALQGCWKSSTEGHEDKYAPNKRRRVRFLERIQSHISSVLGTEDCRSSVSVQSQMQEPLLRPGESLGSMSVIAVAPFVFCLLVISGQVALPGPDPEPHQQHAAVLYALQMGISCSALVSILRLCLIVTTAALLLASVDMRRRERFFECTQRLMSGILVPKIFSSVLHSETQKPLLSPVVQLISLASTSSALLVFCL